MKQEHGILLLAILMFIFMCFGMFLSYTAETRVSEMRISVINYYTDNYICRPKSYPELGAFPFNISS